MQFDRDDPGPGREESIGQDPVSGSDVEDEFSRAHAGVCHDAPGPGTIEPVPPPEWSGLPDHGGPS